MRALVEQIVRDVEPAWARVDRDPRAFSSIAANALANAEVSVDDVLAWLIEDGALPEQDLASGFGEPPLTLRAGNGWAIQLLAWVNGRTTIHEHAFTGAFKVVQGSSLQRRYRWRGERAAPLELGTLELADIQLLERNAVEPIDRALIHSVFHLDRPTLSLVVRTGEVESGRQYDYWAPHVALDPHHVDPRGARQVQTLAMLLRAGRPWIPFAQSILERADAHRRFRVVDLLIGMHGGEMPLALEGIEPVLESIRHARWEHVVGLRREAMTDAAHRFFLAVLLCAPDRTTALALIRARYPDAPILRWIGELTQGDDAQITALCVEIADALMNGRDAVAAVHARNAERKVGDAAVFVAHLRNGPLAALFR